VIDNPTNCKVYIVIHFLHAESVSAAEINHEMCSDYSQNIIIVDGGVEYSKMGRLTNYHSKE
jgi:hypothetical protein